MPAYESVVITRQESGGGEVERLGERCEALLAEHGARIVRREYWGLRKLAYRLRKNRKGHYLMMHVDGPGQAVHELERRLRIEEDVIRFMTLRLDRIPEEPSIIMKSRIEREERRQDERAQREAEQAAASSAEAGPEARDTEETVKESGETATEAGAGEAQ